MLTLGIESSCDETGVSIVEDGWRVRSSVVASQNDLHAEYRGVVPELAGRAHVRSILPVLRTALREADATLNDVGLVAVGHRPGLIGSLLVGLTAAKAIAWSMGLPIVGVDHVHAHLYSPLLDLTEHERPAYPAIGLVVSGGHTSIYRLESPVVLTRLGATIDDAIGEAYDKAATLLDLPFPGGPNLDRLAAEPGANDRAHDLPISRLSPTSLDFSFSGLKTATMLAVRGDPQAGSDPRTADRLTHEERRDIAASFQRAAVRAVLIKLERAFDATPCRSLLVGGGVSANTRLRAELLRLGQDRGIDVRLPPMRYCIDNAAMIAGLGHAMYASGRGDDLTLEPTPTTAC
ncbi:MAG: tRNA (adenosine(37)-N6)-threonylcarbamoyltransferase complex transferase subunit TsaD [Phycisphaeraceae bacterium]|nr:tRNA (adenosine(37)-N6)-threonylcarbamoyltransferase complex transferase subunit TsaD [Phycisphaeraceae bacterium]